MREPARFRSCPLCLGIAMRKVAFGAAQRVQVDRCQRCGGMWVEEGQLLQLRSIGRQPLAPRPDPRATGPIGWCHHCRAPVDREMDQCAACARPNTLDCPDCASPMQTIASEGLRLDVCQHCRGAWFDGHELEMIWSERFARALGPRYQVSPSGVTPAAIDTGELLLYTLFHAPTLADLGAVGAAHASSAITHLPAALAQAPELAGDAVDAVGEVAAGVFEVVVSLISEAFS